MTRVVIVSASVGSGHDAAAAELARRLADAGSTVTRLDFLDLLPWRLGSGVRALYRRQLAVAPQSWQWLLTALARADLLARAVVWVCWVAGRAATRAIGPHTDLVVSTYPLATQLLGALKRRGRMRAPVVTYLTDPSVHPLWIAEGVDLYLATHPATLRQLQRRNFPGPVMIVAPAVPPTFHPARDLAERQRARCGFGLPSGPLALVASGAWAVGEIEQTAREIAAGGVAVPVVVCGENTTLRARLADLCPGVVLGWVSDMPALMRAVDAAVLNSGGMTWAEAYTSGLPTLHYRCLPGHGRANAALLHEAGQVPWVRHTSELSAALRHALAAASPVGVLGSLPGAAPPDPGAAITTLTTATSAASRVPASGSGRLWRPAAAICTAASLLWLGTAGTSLAVAHGFDAPHIRPGQRLSLIIDLDPHQGLTDTDLRALRQSEAAVSITADTLNREPQTIARLAAASTPLVNGGAGAPYETEVLDGRAAIGATAHGITTLSNRHPLLLLSNGDVDALDVALASLAHEHLLVPTASLSCQNPALALPNTGVALLRITPPCALVPSLQRLNTALSTRHLRLSPLTQAGA